MSNTIDTLRTHLFETLAALKDKDAPMDIERAKAVSDIAQVIINTAKVEVDFARVTGKDVSGFIGHNQPRPTPPAAEIGPASPLKTTTQTTGLPNGITAAHQHRLKG